MLSRRVWRRARRTAAALAVTYVLAIAGGCMNPSSPVDLLLNAWPITIDATLQCPSARPTLVVLQHGICRSAWSLWRLERALGAHGYEVLNPSYPSTEATIEQHAARLEAAIERRLAGRAVVPELCFVGHSMGGLVIRSYLERELARPARACVFVATPHRGAALSTVRKELLAYSLFMGAEAGLQLVPGDPFYDTLGPVPAAAIGCIYGAVGDAEGRNDDVPGDDDGTVGSLEAQLEEQTDAIALPFGHTRISADAEMIRQVLAFLHDGTFAR